MSELYEVSDELFTLRRDFLPHENDGVFLSPEMVRLLTDGLFRLGQTALRQAHEISRHRWNFAARHDLEMMGIIEAEAMRPGTNVHLLNVTTSHNTGPDAA